jgi:hypothetical protein
VPISQNLSEFAGRPVEDYDSALTDPEGISYRVRLDFENFDRGGRLPDLLARLLADPQVPRLKSLVIGAWDFARSNDSAPIVALLASAASRLASLEALFFGDIIYEEREISWIKQSDISPLFSALPALRVLGVRGASGLAVGTIKHARLEELVFESGGLPRRIIEAVVAAELPELRHLELWLGKRDYGYEGSLDTLAPLLAGTRFPKLRYLGLKDSEEQDAIARAVALSPLLERLEVLDLSMGTLSDEGAQALLATPAVARLKKLDIHHHFVSPELVQELKKLGPEVDASAPKKPYMDGKELFRYVAVGE